MTRSYSMKKITKIIIKRSHAKFPLDLIGRHTHDHSLLPRMRSKLASDVFKLCSGEGGQGEGDKKWRQMASQTPSCVSHVLLVMKRTKASPLPLSSLQLGTAEPYLEINAHNTLHSRNVVGCSFSYWL